MVFIAASIVLAVCALPSVMGLTLDTPTGGVSNGALDVTWTTVAGDPAFTLLLQGPDPADAATGIDPTLLKETVNLGPVAPGTYTLQAVNADDIETVLSTTGSFQITAANAAGDAAAAGGAAADTTAVAATAAAATAAAATAAAAPATAAPATTGKKGKGGAAAKAGAAGKAKAVAGKAKGAAAAKAKGGAAKAKGGRSVSSVKFGRRELYRD